MKRGYLIVAVVIFFIVSCIGCFRREYPDTIAEYWYCDEIDFTLNVTTKSSELVWKDMQYEVAIGFTSGRGYEVFIENGDDMVHQDEVLFGGSWSYKWGKLVLKISDDWLFGGVYKELVFEPISSD